MEGSDLYRVERSLVEGSGLRWRGAVSSGGEWSQAEGSDRWWSGVIAGGGERSLVEGSGRTIVG